MQRMKTQQAIDYAGSPLALAALLGLTASAISQWGEDVPPLRQIQLERITGGKLKADPRVFAEPSERGKRARAI